MYVIKKGNLYVAKPGSKKSYTTSVERAQVFKTLEDAQKNKCGNESIVSLYPILSAMTK